MENHTHTHSHTHGDSSEQETLALLEYMAHHNEHHAEELHKLAHGAPENAASLILEAVALMNEGNCKIRKALEIMKGE